MHGVGGECSWLYAASHFGARVRISDAISDEGLNTCPSDRPPRPLVTKTLTIGRKCDAQSTPSGRNKKLPTLHMLEFLVNYKGIDSYVSKSVVNYNGHKIHSETV